MNRVKSYFSNCRIRNLNLHRTGLLLVGLLALFVTTRPADATWNQPQSLHSVQVATLTPTEEPLPTLVPTVTANNQWVPLVHVFGGVPMLLVPPGCFMMGNDQGRLEEKPVNHQCFDKPFWFDKYDVTNAQFKQFNGKAGRDSNWTDDNRPRERITWFEAKDFCALRGARLPTEAEWEYAARGPDGLAYPWGNTWNADNAVFASNDNYQTADVGSKPAGASWIGALDMAGNVWQWTSTIIQPYPYHNDDGRESTTDTSSARVLRGGSWVDYQDNLGSSYRYSFDPSNADVGYGFRCARDFAS